MGTTLTKGGTRQPRLYVACLAAYNVGTLHGAWIDATADAWAMWSGVGAMLRASPILDAEDYAILDHEGFGERQIERFASLDGIGSIVAALEADNAVGAMIDEGEFAGVQQAMGW